MKKKGLKIASGITGAACLLGGCAPAAVAPVVEAAPEADVASAPEAEAQEDMGVAIEAREQESYTKVANVKGAFAFNQDVLTPPDEIFNLFGTAATYACAKPGFAFDEVNRQEYYINVSGNIKKACTVGIAELEKMESVERNMVCTCAMSVTAAQASVRGVRVADVISMADLEDGVNTITMKDSDGYGIPMPLSYALEKNAMLVYKVNGEALPDGVTSQLWMPGSVAKYFTRNIVNIEVSAEEETPEIIKAGEEYRAHISVMNDAGEASFAVGEKIVFEGYADDYDVPIAAIEVSMDDGETWTSCEVKDATADKWVYWYFGYTPEEAGTYKLEARARTAEGVVSPLASAIVFSVEEGSGL